MRRRRMPDRGGQESRPIRAGAIGAACWIGISTLAIALFASEHDPGRPFDGHLFGFEELIAFSCAFAASGAVSGPVALGASGDRRRGIAMGAMLVVAAVATACLAVRGYPALAVRRYGATPREAARFREQLIEYGSTGLTLGLVGGLVVAAVAVAGGLALRRGMARTLGLALATALVAATAFLLPLGAARLAALAHRLDWAYTGRGSRAVIGASAGSVTGAMCGLIVALLVSRCLSAADARRHPADATATSRPPPPTSRE